MAKKIVDLFAGCGGFSLGAHHAGFETAVAVDVDPILTSSFRKNFPKSNLVLRDISKLDPKEILALLDGARPDGVIGGPPCQGFSTIGKREKNDPRNRLLWHFFRQIKGLRPKFFIMENVPGLLTSNGKNILCESLEQIENKYHIIGPIEIDAANYGAATKRKRVIVIGYDPELCDEIKVADIEKDRKLPTTVQDAIADLPSPGETDPEWSEYDWRKYPQRKNLSQYAKDARKSPSAGLGDKLAAEKISEGYISGFQPTIHSKGFMRRIERLDQGDTDKISKFPRLRWDGQCSTLRAGTGPERGSYQSVRPIHPDQSRVITVREAARLQGFPDWFLFHPAKWHSFRMIGNSVSPIVSRALCAAINNIL